MCRVFTAILLLALIGCSPGFRIDRARSDSYYQYVPSGRVFYSPNGNWFELGWNRMVVDRRSFRVLDEAVAKDCRAVYFRDKPAKVDYATFRVDHGVYKDSLAVYQVTFSGLQPVQVRDPATFRYLAPNGMIGRWGQDRLALYLDYRFVRVDRATAQVLTENFVVDRDSLRVAAGRVVRAVARYGLRYGE